MDDEISMTCEHESPKRPAGGRLLVANQVKPSSWFATSRASSCVITRFDEFHANSSRLARELIERRPPADKGRGGERPQFVVAIYMERKVVRFIGMGFAVAV